MCIDLIFKHIYKTCVYSSQTGPWEEGVLAVGGGHVLCEEQTGGDRTATGGDRGGDRQRQVETGGGDRGGDRAETGGDIGGDKTLGSRAFWP